jgi:hypothetical protein
MTVPIFGVGLLSDCCTLAWKLLSGLERKLKTPGKPSS